MPDVWWHDFFDADYLSIWGGLFSAESDRRDAEELCRLLGLGEGDRVLDAPCGYGRLSRSLAELGCAVVGVDQSAALLQRAEAARADLEPDRLRYLQRDLREPLDPEELGGELDAAINIFSSLGYGTDEDDLAILSNLAATLRPGGRLFVETMHRDVVAARMAQGMKPSHRLADGTLLVEEQCFDPVAGRIDTTWYWCGPRGEGSKTASLRLYCITELVHLIERAGLSLVGAFRGISSEPFVAEGPDMGGRIGILAKRL